MRFKIYCFIYNKKASNYKNNEILNNINSGASVEISGILVESLGKGQKIEIKVTEIKFIFK